MKKLFKPVLMIVAVIAVLWIIITIWVEREGPPRLLELGAPLSGQKALIVYDADPLYNLDQQVCEAFGHVLADQGWNVTVATVAGAKNSTTTPFNLYVFCANTYNWSPDQAVVNFIKKQQLNGRKAIAITLGGGSTGRSQRILETLIKRSNADLIDSRVFWLWRPNDEKKLKENNINVTIDMVHKWAHAIAIKALNRPVSER